jgi:hypothetical protein
MITIFWIDYKELQIKSESVKKKNDNELFNKMNLEHPDGWWGTFAEAEKYLYMMVI